jgi:hypothetical protein
MTLVNFWFYYSKTLYKSFDFPILWIWAYLMTVITLGVPDDGYYSGRTWWRLLLWAYLMTVITLGVPDDGYYSERTWWRLLLWAYLMTVITLGVPDDGYYSGHTWWRLLLWAYLMMVITLGVPDDGYYSGRTWWQLFQKQVVHTKLDIYVLITYSIQFGVLFKVHNLGYYLKYMFWGII